MNFCNTQDCGRSEGSATRGVLLKSLVIFAILGGGVSWERPSGVFAQTHETNRPAANQSTPVLPGQTSATIGRSGFKVPIPEIKMNRILGERKGSDKEKVPPPSGEQSSREQAEPPPPRPAEKSQDQPTPLSPPAKSEPTEAAAQQPESSPEQITPPREPGSTQPTGPIKSTEEQSPEPAGQPKVDSSSISAPVPHAVEDGGQKEEVESIMKAPQAPEDVVAPPPPPKKEVLRPTAAAQIPPVLKNTPSKEGPAALTIRRTEVDDLADPREWVQLDQRRMPEIEPPPDLGPLPRKKIGALEGDMPIAESERVTRFQEPRLQSSPKPLKEPEPAERPAVDAAKKPDSPPLGPVEAVPPSRQAETTQSSSGEPPVESGEAKESPPVTAAVQPRLEQFPPKETISPVEEPSSSPKEVLPSPLDDSALTSPKVRNYLQQTAPILEELSVLMTTAPSLNLADYDPSESTTNSVPQDIYLRMDAIKRQLQILDSKTFAIIPPPKYSAFHSLVRESIAETYQACTAIMGYLQDNNIDDLRVIREHLERAKKLIQRTRPANQG